MNKLTDTRNVTKITYLFMITYMVSYITRINYGAVISEMVEATSMSKSALSLALTGSFATYGAGQIISGICGDRFRPKKLVLYGLIATSLMNIIIPFCQSPILMLVVWSINGFAQACMWPPMVKLMVGLFDTATYSRASTMVSWGSSFGTIIIYLLSPVIIMVSGWRTLFFITGGCAVVMALVWLRCCEEPNFEKPALTAKGVVADRKDAKFFTPLLVAIMFAIMLQGALRDGVTTWMPSFISETFRLSSEVSILSGVCLPIFSILSLRLALALYEKLPGNPVRCAAIIFALGAVAALVLSFVAEVSPIGSIACMALLTGSMHGVNLMLICMVPPFFQRKGNISTVSGVLNSCTYVGSAISTYGIALLSESAGWQTTSFVWFLIAALGAVVCTVCSRIWK